MSTLNLISIHLSAILMAAMLGGIMLIKRKGTRRHKTLGRAYVAFMLIACISSLFIPTQFNISLNNHFGLIHLLSVFSLFCLYFAIQAIRRKQIKMHALWMIGLYFGGIIITGIFAFMPGRLLHTYFFT